MNFRNVWNVWRTVLEENEKLARARLAAVEVFQQQIADDAKILKLHKVQVSKKVNPPWFINLNYRFNTFNNDLYAIVFKRKTSILDSIS